MVITPILIVIGAVISAIWSGVKTIGEKAIDLARDLFTFLLEMFKTFLNVAPKPVKILFFFFFILTIANTVTGFFVQMNYACLDGNLREYNSVIGGFRGYWEGIGEDLDNSTTDYEAFITNTTSISERFGDGEQYTDLLNVRCFGNNPRLSFLKIDFLNAKYWIIILIIGSLITIKIKGMHL